MQIEFKPLNHIEMENEKSKKQLWEDNLKAKYPDRDFADEDSFYAVSMEGYDADHEALKQSKADNDKLVGILTENPDIAVFVGLLANGEDQKALASLADAIKAAETDEGWETYRGEMARKKELADKAEKEQEEYLKNMEKSAEALKEFASEAGLSEEEAVDFVKNLQETITDKLFSGNIDKEFFKRFYNLINYDNDVAAAKEAGRIAGRNEKIEKKRAKDVMGSEIPAIQSGASEPVVEAPENPTLSALKGMVKQNTERNKYF